MTCHGAWFTGMPVCLLGQSGCGAEDTDTTGTCGPIEDCFVGEFFADCEARAHLAWLATDGLATPSRAR